MNPAENRRRFILVSAVVGLSLLGDALLYALLPARPGEFRVLVWQVGVLLGMNRFVRLVTNELAGRLVQTRRSNHPLAWAVVVGSLVTACYALPIGFWGLLAARIVWGACWSLFRVEGYMSALALSSQRNRGRVFAVYQAVTRLGQGGGVLVGGFLSDLLGIPRTFLIFSLCTFLGIFLVFRTPLSEAASAVHHPPTSRRAAAARHDRLPPAKGHTAGLLGALARWPLALWGCALSVTMTEQMITNLTGRFVAERIAAALPVGLGIASLTGILLSFRSLGSLLFGPLAGLLSDRFGRKRITVGLVFLQGLAIAGLAFFRPWQLIIACLLLQLSVGMSAELLVYALSGDLAPEKGGALHMSRFSTFVDLGTSLGPVVAFALYAAFGFLPVALLSWLLLAVLLLLLCLFIA